MLKIPTGSKSISVGLSGNDSSSCRQAFMTDKFFLASSVCMFARACVITDTRMFVLWMHLYVCVHVCVCLCACFEYVCVCDITGQFLCLGVLVYVHV